VHDIHVVDDNRAYLSLLFTKYLFDANISQCLQSEERALNRLGSQSLIEIDRGGKQQAARKREAVRIGAQGRRHRRKLL